ncbi:hypothetical protein V9T40_012133 [Parthenolecanium corni]|uniref:Uncharacterized protein n=1 Tax=Parthenolecanium corni TaxID=536013 RepID=A0AAN9TJW3_9HEMI
MIDFNSTEFRRIYTPRFKGGIPWDVYFRGYNLHPSLHLPAPHTYTAQSSPQQQAPSFLWLRCQLEENPAQRYK